MVLMEDKDILKTEETEKTEALRGAAEEIPKAAEEDPEAAGAKDIDSSKPVSGETRVYDVLNKDTRIVPRQASRHTWISDASETIIKPISSDTLSAMDAVIPAPDRKTRIADLKTPPATRRVTVADLERKLLMEEAAEEARRREAEVLESGSSEGLREKAAGIAASVKGTADSIRRVKVADSRRFRIFIRIIGVFVLILLLELGYFRFAAHVKGMPETVSETKKELELTKKENELLAKELEVLGDYDSAEELKQSWERLKEKVEKAAGETYY